MTDLTAHRTATPLGPFTVLVAGEVVHAAGFTDSVEQLAQLADAEPGSVAVSDDDHSALAAVRKYFEGDLSAIDEVVTKERPGFAPFRPSSTSAEAAAQGSHREAAAPSGVKPTAAMEPRPKSRGSFYAAARQELRRIPAGTTYTYTQLAAKAGNARAIRAAGSACATNPTALFVPCHRVVRTDGSLGGFLYGLEIKQALLDHEAKCA